MSTILTTIRWLSIFAGALSLFYLGHAWFEFGLSEVFHRIYVWYAGILHPVVELLKPMALWVVGLIGWSLPAWWKDAVVLYFAMGAATGRGSDVGPDPTFGMDSEAQHDLSERIKRQVAIEVYLTPLRVVAWPAFWIANVVQALFRRFPSIVIRLGYIGTSTIEFAKMLTGTLIFAALNAGL